jgi:signal transduction histidine kinase
MLFLETKGFPIKDASGNITSVIETINNITEKHLLEEERLKTQKLRIHRHPCRLASPMTSTIFYRAYSDISHGQNDRRPEGKSRSLCSNKPRRPFISRQSSDSALDLFQGGTPVKKLIDLRAVIDNSVKFTLSGSRSDFRLDLPEDLWQAQADEGQLGQVIQNIALNADQAMPVGGTVIVTAANMAEGVASLPRTRKRTMS